MEFFKSLKADFHSALKWNQWLEGRKLIKRLVLKNRVHSCEILGINGLKQNLQCCPPYHSAGTYWLKLRVLVQNKYLEKKKRDCLCYKKKKENIFLHWLIITSLRCIWKCNVSPRLFSPNHCIISQIKSVLLDIVPGQICCGTASFLFEGGCCSLWVLWKNFFWNAQKIYNFFSENVFYCEWVYACGVWV